MQCFPKLDLVIWPKCITETADGVWYLFFSGRGLGLDRLPPLAYWQSRTSIKTQPPLATQQEASFQDQLLNERDIGLVEVHRDGLSAYRRN